MGPDIRDSTLQFVPNWNAITIPETTPSPNAIPKTLSQNSKTCRYTERPVHRCSASRTVSHAASPIVKDGKMIWKEMVNANCSRDSRSAVRSIGISSPVSRDPLGMGEHLEPVVACDADEGKARHLCGADRQSRRRRHPDDDRRSHHADFLHEPDGNPARQYDNALGSRQAFAQQRARQFVERVVPSYIFSENQALIRLPKRRGMDRASLHVQRLARRQRGHCFFNVPPAPRQGLSYNRNCAIGFGQTLQSAHAASGGSNKPTAPCGERIGSVAR